uniref:Uncharacterized protein n=1 Tax=Populus alba TaxID=43335 RepID=A0A4U5PW41_POPAL|nr:hypothetical protein D5086_0000170720 [Populus alba]
MVASTGDTYTQGSFSPNHGQSQVHTRQFQSYNGNRNRSKGRFPQGSRFFGPKPGFSSMAPVLPNSNSGVLGQSPAQPFRHPSALMVPICQLCNSEGHTAPFCRASPPKRTRCNICGRSNHTSWYCFYNDKGPNYMASYSPQSSFSMQPQPLQYTPYQASPSQSREVQQSPMQAMQQYTPYQASSSQNREVQQSPMQAMHTVIHSASPSSYLVSTPSNTIQSSLLSSCPVTVVNTTNSIISTSPASSPRPFTTHTPASTPAPSADSVSSQSVTAPLSTTPLLPVAPEVNLHSDFSSHGFIPDNLQVVLSIPPLNLHPMQTRSKNGIIKKKALLATIQVSAATDLHLVEPATYKAALKIPESLVPELLRKYASALAANSFLHELTLPSSNLNTTSNLSVSLSNCMSESKD